MLATESRGRFVISVLSLALPVVLLWRCAGRTEPPSNAPADSAPRQDAPLTAPPSTAPPLTSERVNPSASGDAPSLATTPSPAASLTAATPSASSSTAAPIIAAVAQRDARDLALLSRIERELLRDPPAAVHGLIRMRAAGASRSQLLAEAEKQLPRDLPLRLLVRRWIDEVAPDGTPVAKPLGPAPSGTHKPLIKPIQRANSP